MARYAIDILIPANEQSMNGVNPAHKGDNFDYENPLGVSKQLSSFVAIYLPWLVVITTGLNIFGVWVLKSNFLRGLVLQPMIRVYLQLHCLLMVTGPFYVWLGHSFGVFLTHDQVSLE
ncbi:hypothetical protein Btru_007955 [Bulinus truncatus]|nr:hypothetical protein Btru_007955 [Bulinus truncatus]